MPKQREDTTTVTGGPTQPEAMEPAPTVAEMPAAVAGPQTTPDLPVVDDEATRIDPSPAPKRAKATRPKEEDDDESTKHTGTPKKAREAQKILEESRRMNAAGGPKPVPKKLHPLIPIGVAIALLAVLLMVVSWVVRSPPTDPQTGAPQPGRVRSFFDW